jgi:hypothetical protein
MYFLFHKKCRKKKEKYLFILVTDLICYYGKQIFNLKTPDQRQALDKLLDNNIKTGTNTVQNNPSNSNNSQQNPNLSPLNANKNSFFEKNKRYIIITGIIVVVIIIISIIILIIMRCCQSSNKDFDKRMSGDSSIE